MNKLLVNDIFILLIKYIKSYEFYKKHNSILFYL